MRFDLVSPEERVASYDADAVDLPGSEGDMTAMEGHAALITGLRPGMVTSRSGDETKSFIVSGGFAEVTASGVVILADEVYKTKEFTSSDQSELVERIASRAKDDTGLAKDLSDKKIADAKAISLN